jgi:hypothetical protein
MIRRLTAEFVASADRWGVARRVALLATIVPLVGMVALAALFVVWRGAFRLLLDEDGVAEWLQIVCWIAVAVFAAAIAARRWRAGHRWQALLFGLVTLAMVFVVGEEISWGQRIFGFETPEELIDINLQGEVTLHNIGRTLFIFNMALLATSLYAIVAEPIGRRLNVGRRWAHAEWLFLPPFFLAGAFLTMAGYRIVRAWVLTMDSYALTQLSEWAELCYAAAIFGFLVLVWRHLPAAGESGKPASATQ